MMVLFNSIISLQPVKSPVTICGDINASPVPQLPKLNDTVCNSIVFVWADEAIMIKTSFLAQSNLLSLKTMLMLVGWSYFEYLWTHLFTHVSLFTFCWMVLGLHADTCFQLFWWMNVNIYLCFANGWSALLLYCIVQFGLVLS
jgi:hypothetical protein